MESPSHTAVLSIRGHELSEEREAVQVTDRSSKEKVFKVKRIQVSIKFKLVIPHQSEG